MYLIVEVQAGLVEGAFFLAIPCHAAALPNLIISVRRLWCISLEQNRRKALLYPKCEDRSLNTILQHTAFNECGGLSDTQVLQRCWISANAHVSSMSKRTIAQTQSHLTESDG